MSTTATFRPATERQLEFLIDLGKKCRSIVNQLPEEIPNADERGLANLKFGYGIVLDEYGKQVKAGTLDFAGASRAIDTFKEMIATAKPHVPRSATAGAKAEPEPGMYRQPDGTIVRVYLGQQSGKMLLKQLVGTPNGERTHEYEYVGAAAYKLHKDAQPLTLEEAKEFGRMTGSCCVCARRLDNPESVEAGIGPVCGRKMEQGFTR